MKIRPLRIGLFVDGTFYERAFSFYLEQHDRRAPLSLGGLSDWFCNEVARRSQRDLGLCRVVESRYFRPGANGGSAGRAEALVDRELRRQGFVLQDSADAGSFETTFAVEVLDLAHRLELDVAILVTGSPAFAPLARKLAGNGTVVMVPGFDLSGGGRGARRTLRTARALLEEAAWPVPLGQAIETSPDNPLVRALFLARRPQPTEPASSQVEGSGPEAPKEVPPVSPASSVPPGRTGDSEPAAPAGPLHGTIADVRERMGFLTEEWNGKKLFFHHSALVGVTLGDLKQGERVVYERGLDPRDRPCAKRVERLAQEDSAPVPEPSVPEPEPPVPEPEPPVPEPEPPVPEPEPPVPEPEPPVPEPSVPEPEPDPVPEPEPAPVPEPEPAPVPVPEPSVPEPEPAPVPEPSVPEPEPAPVPEPEPAPVPEPEPEPRTD